MRRLALILAALLLSIAASAQGRFGVLGGVTLSSAPKLPDYANVDTYKTAALYHAGFTYQYKFTLGFSVQPSVLYQVKGTKVANASGAYDLLREGAVEVPVALQWGPDLLLFRPYVEVVPFVGININSSEGLVPEKFESGVGLGGGIEIWKVQVSARYNWNFNPYCKQSEGGETPWSFRCTTISLGLLF